MKKEMKTTTDISKLIARKILGDTLAPEEEAALQAWLSDGRNAATYEEVKRLDLVSAMLRLEREDYGGRMVARFRRTQQRRMLRLFLRRASVWTGVAAVVALLFLAVPRSARRLAGDSTQQTAMTIVPGEPKAILTLADGQQIDVTGGDHRVVDRLLDSVSMALADTVAVRYNTLSIPRGGEFRYELADGTRVWLNAESELRFPETFGGGERRVYVKGEVFFDVAHDEAHPFVVSTGRGDVRVLGTRFNLTDYAGTPLAATLVEGRIRFHTPDGRDYDVRPSQQLTFDEAGGTVDVQTVDVSVYTAWVDHQFVFRNQSLEDILTTLSRWYDFHPVFADDSLRDIRLSGRLYRGDDIRVLLNSYERAAGIRFVIRGENILVMN